MAAKMETWRRRYPTVADLRRRARRRVPRFVFDFVDGGANNEETARRSRKAMSAVELLPHYCMDIKDASTAVELFGRRYAAPIGVSPMGGGLMWPGADECMAREAQRRNIPFVLSTPGSASIERIAEIAGDVFWFQLYRFPDCDHAITFDLVRRAEESGAHVLVPTIDSVGKSKRPRDMRNGFKMPLAVTPSIALQVACSPAWALALWRRGIPRSESIVPYMTAQPTRGGMPGVTMGGTHRWDELARLRDRWKRALVVKGVQHPKDAERLVALGVDGLIVSNHGGRLFDGAPPTIDILPMIVAAVGSSAQVMIDSGIEGGLDIVRALALGAVSTFAGRPFLYGLGALGEAGAGYVMDMYLEELRCEFQSLGIASVSQAKGIAVRHPGAWRQLDGG